MTADGRTRRGTIDAEDRRVAIELLRGQGVYVIELAETQRWRRVLQPSDGSVLAREIYIGNPVKPRDFAVMVRQLATLLKAGVVITDALQILSKQSESKALRNALATMVSRVQSGAQLSQAAAEHPKIFPPVFINMLRAGEVSGNLEDILERLAQFHEREYYTRQKVRSALTYPVVVGIIAITVTVFLLVRVIPTFVTLFEGYHVELPLPTRIVIGVSNALVHGWYAWLALLVLLIGGYQWAVRQPRGRYLRDWLWMKVPVFGSLTQKSVIARMSRTLATLFSSGVPILQALRLVADVVDNAVVRRVLQECAERLTGGQSLAEPFSDHRVFPPLVGHMIRVGEDTGQLDGMLSKLADFYEAETDVMADQLKSLLEPLMVLFLACIVGTIVASVILPMFTLYQSLGSGSIG